MLDHSQRQLCLTQSQKRRRLAASCGFYRLVASCQQVVASLLPSSNCSKSVKIRLVVNCYLQTLQVVETTSIKLVDKKSWQSTCIKPVDSLQQTCYHQAGASDANASWYRLDDSKVTSLQQTWCNLRVSGCIKAGPSALPRHRGFDSCRRTWISFVRMILAPTRD